MPVDPHVSAVIAAINALVVSRTAPLENEIRALKTGLDGVFGQGDERGTRLAQLLIRHAALQMDLREIDQLLQAHGYRDGTLRERVGLACERSRGRGEDDAN